MTAVPIDFVQAASDFGTWADAPPGSPSDEVRRATRILARLYAAGLSLESPADLDSDHEGTSLDADARKAVYDRFAVLPFGFYAVVFDPHNLGDPSPAFGDVADDLTDIYTDLMVGLSLCSAGFVGEAVWSWHFAFHSHWGRHAVSAMRALHLWEQPGQPSVSG